MIVLWDELMPLGYLIVLGIIVELINYSLPSPSKSNNNWKETEANKEGYVTPNIK